MSHTTSNSSYSNSHAVICFSQNNVCNIDSHQRYKHKRKGEATQFVVPCSIQDSKVSFHVLLSVAARDKHTLRETHYYYNIWFYLGILTLFRNIIKGWFKKLLQPFI
jgi:hypothetical protein